MKLWKTLLVGLVATVPLTVTGVASAGTTSAGPSRQAATTALRAAQPLDTVDCYDNITIKGANGNFVSTELGYTGAHHGELRARATAVGPWELFGLCRSRDTGETVLWSEANGNFVSAELGYGGSDYGELRARATEIGPWEKFFTPNTPGYGNTYFFSYANEGFVSAELGYTGDGYAKLRARAADFGAWETFRW